MNKSDLPKAQLGSAFKALSKGAKAVGTAYKEERALRAANKLAEAKKAKRAEAAAKAAETRKANLAAKQAEAKKATETTKAKKTVASKPKRITKKEQAAIDAKRAKDDKTAGRILTGVSGAGVIGGTAAVMNVKKGKTEKAIEESKPDWSKTKTTTSDDKKGTVVKNVLKSVGRYKFATGGVKSSKPGAAKYSKMSNKQTRSAASAVKAMSTRKPMVRPSIKKR